MAATNAALKPDSLPDTNEILIGERFFAAGNSDRVINSIDTGDGRMPSGWRIREGDTVRIEGFNLNNFLVKLKFAIGGNVADIPYQAIIPDTQGKSLSFSVPASLSEHFAEGAELQLRFVTRGGATDKYLVPKFYYLGKQQKEQVKESKSRGADNRKQEAGQADNTTAKTAANTAGTAAKTVAGAASSAGTLASEAVSGAAGSILSSLSNDDIDNTADRATDADIETPGSIISEQLISTQAEIGVSPEAEANRQPATVQIKAVGQTGTTGGSATAVAADATAARTVVTEQAVSAPLAAPSLSVNGQVSTEASLEINGQANLQSPSIGAPAVSASANVEVQQQSTGAAAAGAGPATVVEAQNPANSKQKILRSAEAPAEESEATQDNVGIKARAVAAGEDGSKPAPVLSGSADKSQSQISAATKVPDDKVRAEGQGREAAAAQQSAIAAVGLGKFKDNAAALANKLNLAKKPSPATKQAGVNSGKTDRVQPGAAGTGKAEAKDQASDAAAKGGGTAPPQKIDVAQPQSGLVKKPSSSEIEQTQTPATLAGGNQLQKQVPQQQPQAEQGAAEQNSPEDQAVAAPIIAQDPAKTNVALDKELEEGTRLLNKLLNDGLLDAIYWIWLFAAPSFGLTILLGAVAGDFLFLLKNPLIDFAVKRSKLPLISSEVVQKNLNAIKEKIKFGLWVKVNVVIMNLVVALVVFVAVITVVAFLKESCDGLIQGFTIRALGYGNVCDAVNNLTTGVQNTTNQQGQAAAAGAAQPLAPRGPTP